MPEFNRHAYGPAIAALLIPCEMPLGPGEPRLEFRPALQALATCDSLTAPGVTDSAAAACCRAGLWLYHNFLDEAHEICQDIETPEASYWHGQVHRREGDFDNARYWFRRAGAHPVHATLAQRACAALPDSHPRWAKQLLAGGGWNAAALVDWCAAAVAGETPAALPQRWAQWEWEALFDFCFRRARAGSPAQHERASGP